ncbi:MAG: hypothetical protein K0S47_2062 [Herbinix sp.]|jgi:hypothetical protein|nr:hypothetical protein [Herbinix sp.]
MTSRELLDLEMRKCFDFFWDTSNHIEGSKGYGLMLDRSNNPALSSIASVGFALSSIVVGVLHKYISYEEGLHRAKGTLHTLLYNVPHYEGFFVHFCDMMTAKRHKNCEYSTIDTALCLNGILVIDAFFKDEEVHRMSEAIINRTDYSKFVFYRDQKAFFHMAYNDIVGGDYTKDGSGFISAWDMTAEQLMMYIQAAGQDNIDEETARNLYLSFDRPYGMYKDIGCYYEPGGVLFVHQYSHCWFKFLEYKGCDNIDWSVNTKNATLAQIKWCQDQPHIKTFREGLWGVSAMDGKEGYIVHGTVPSRSMKPHSDGTIGPCAIAGSLPYTYEESAVALQYIYHNHPTMWGPYGFYDSMNSEQDWYASTYLGIDKGETILMINNALYGEVWDLYMNHPRVKNAIHKLGMIPSKIKQIIP